MGKPLAPTAIQLGYFADLRALVGHMHELTTERLVPLLPRMLGEPHPDARTDAAPGPWVNRIVRQMQAAFERRWPTERISRLPRRVAVATSEHQKRELFRQLKAGLGIELAAIADRGLTRRIEQFTAENVSLIRSIAPAYFGQVEQVALAGIRAGDRADKIAGDLADRASVARSRAKLIARDQVSKLTGELNHARQSSLGIEQYIWRTMNDNRVRSDHEERDGNTYDWSKAPGDPDDPRTGGHPGRAINCRCYAEPILSGILDALGDR